MPDDAGAGDEARSVGEATAFLAERGVPPTAREFRLRQEFFRHGWDVRVRDEGGTWTVRAVKPDRPDAAAVGATEGAALRLALAAALSADEATGAP
ncbi:MAG: hypothetical protein AVDCRST_MAG73-2137 [uncultured Thermomicrobiales bacterium]|uniref:Uncharacterized protein n=1 Tax=uncultured Thermomicrobiales bacterium TaxID=1645740 RepID=A0A6J4U8B0_9BACT|nr:MAG: hypothetical protein AVDCRST_MAG73-2137 [uncultured Thermomicrobiales bacterium]